MSESLESLAQAARSAYRKLALAETVQKNEALRGMANCIRHGAQNILDANREDLAFAMELAPPMRDRLMLDEPRIEAMAKCIEMIAELPDPVGKTLAKWTRPNGLKIARVTVPLGVIGMIFESRPNVAADAAGLCMKAGNAVILRPGSESFQSCAAIVACLHSGMEKSGLPSEAVQLVPDASRAVVDKMLNMPGLIDVLIPRGGKTLTEKVMRESRVPTLLHLDGNCHTYIHAKADLEMAKEILVNAKMRRTGICGATESLIIDFSIIKKFLPELVTALRELGCELVGDEQARISVPEIGAAMEADWSAEYLAPKLSIKTVSGLEEAIHHINRYGSHHTDAIITKNKPAAETFLREVDSAIVLHNASTQFADGGEFGFGAEIGIATGRLHARGPVGTEQLVTYKYVIHGSGQVRPG